ncbi:hypothetical protein NDN08_001462 [Rhodosorus marinus]|uniref:PHD-type domain-containing protein n=1 Tax=Rhodosorus marinus TaxID=101924 RepID=A0AAV8UR27_9RHOD|nr:hypothetical protein NDN08_001462 [Rhodosorus marinus]
MDRGQIAHMTALLMKSASSLPLTPRGSMSLMNSEDTSSTETEECCSQLSAQKRVQDRNYLKGGTAAAEDSTEARLASANRTTTARTIAAKGSHAAAVAVKLEPQVDETITPPADASSALFPKASNVGKASRLGLVPSGSKKKRQKKPNSPQNCEVCGKATNMFSSSGRFCSSSCSHKYSGSFSARKSIAKKKLRKPSSPAENAEEKSAGADTRPSVPGPQPNPVAATLSSPPPLSAAPSSLAAEPPALPQRGPNKTLKRKGVSTQKTRLVATLDPERDSNLEARENYCELRADYMYPFAEADVKLSALENESCVTCGSGGTLLVCSRCPRAVHLPCVDPPLYTVPDGDWYCRSCSAPQTSKEQSEGQLFDELIQAAAQRNPLCMALDADRHTDYTEKHEGDWFRCDACRSWRPVDSNILSEMLETGLECNDMFWLSACVEQGCEAGSSRSAAKFARRSRKRYRDELMREFGADDYALFREQEKPHIAQVPVPTHVELPLKKSPEKVQTEKTPESLFRTEGYRASQVSSETVGAEKILGTSSHVEVQAATTGGSETGQPKKLRSDPIFAIAPATKSSSETVQPRKLRSDLSSVVSSSTKTSPETKQPTDSTAVGMRSATDTLSESVQKGQSFKSKIKNANPETTGQRTDHSPAPKALQWLPPGISGVSSGPPLLPEGVVGVLPSETPTHQFNTDGAQSPASRQPAVKITQVQESAGQPQMQAGKMAFPAVKPCSEVAKASTITPVQSSTTGSQNIALAASGSDVVDAKQAEDNATQDAMGAQRTTNPGGKGPGISRRSSTTSTFSSPKVGPEQAQASAIPKTVSSPSAANTPGEKSLCPLNRNKDEKQTPSSVGGPQSLGAPEPTNPKPTPARLESENPVASVRVTSHPFTLAPRNPATTASKQNSGTEKPHAGLSLTEEQSKRLVLTISRAAPIAEQVSGFVRPASLASQIAPVHSRGDGQAGDAQKRVRGQTNALHRLPHENGSRPVAGLQAPDQCSAWKKPSSSESRGGSEKEPHEQHEMSKKVPENQLEKYQPAQTAWRRPSSSESRVGSHKNTRKQLEVSQKVLQAQRKTYPDNAVNLVGRGHGQTQAAMLAPSTNALGEIHILDSAPVEHPIDVSPSYGNAHSAPLTRQTGPEIQNSMVTRDSGDDSYERGQILKGISSMGIEDEDVEDELVALVMDGNKELKALYYGFSHRPSKFLRHAERFLARRRSSDP